ncbi:HlyD family secretion protein [Sphingomonas sp. LH128]|uniref:efflux RND transporter periplasmic adaptor subunit n=1 Tax=Sphingomonas sp. LH128 TaxID=473781 RepID=UPI00027CA333|nr:efflux RND transporter periplasmic adaptor subunit [Sphingomonas sp. LH128]EJU13431.1 HlyD family secretion protein [Sphingomonas sp. LH128]
MNNANDRLLSLAGVGAVLGGALLLAGCHGKPDEVAEMPPQTVTTALVAMRELKGGQSASGRLLPQEEMAVAPDLSGFRVARVLVEEGAAVRAGQPLALLDDSLLQSQVRQLEAQLMQQRVAAEQARDQSARVAGLDNEGVLSNEAIAQRRFAARNADAAAAATRAQLDDLLVRRAHLTIRAPFDGTVIERTVRPGDTASVGTAMFRMARGGLIELYAELPERDASRIHVGDVAQVVLASGRTLDGKVRLLGERVDAATGLMIARIALPRDAELRAGGFAKARFAGARAALSVPDPAVNYDADGASVMLVDGGSRVHRVRVVTGEHSGGFVELRRGPPAGTRVAVKGAAFTLDGDKVKIAMATGH